MVSSNNLFKCFRTLEDLSDLSENDSSGTEIEDLISSSEEEEPEDIMSGSLILSILKIYTPVSAPQ